MQCHDDSDHVCSRDESQHAISDDLLPLERKNRMSSNQDRCLYHIHPIVLMFYHIPTKISIINFSDCICKRKLYIEQNYWHATFVHDDFFCC